MLKQGKALKRTALKKVSEKKKTEDPQIKKDQQEEDWKFYMELWNERPKKCEVCGVPFFTEEPRSYYFEHLLEKSKYPELRHEKENVAFTCWESHGVKTNGHPKPKHLELINKAKEIFGKK